MLVSVPVLALLCCTRLAFAHAVIQKASLDASAVKANTATRVTLTFNSAIEPRFTKLTLVNERGEERPLVVGPAIGPAMVSVELPPLGAGIYALRYKVLAVDGHVTENVLRFNVAPPE
jgi:methionine-rich copper-binding protein CopC